MSNHKQAKAIRRAVERELNARGYDNYPADRELYDEALDDVTAAVVAVLERGSSNGSDD